MRLSSAFEIVACHWQYICSSLISEETCGRSFWLQRAGLSRAACRITRITRSLSEPTWKWMITSGERWYSGSSPPCTQAPAFLSGSGCAVVAPMVLRSSVAAKSSPR